MKDVSTGQSKQILISTLLAVVIITLLMQLKLYVNELYVIVGLILAICCYLSEILFIAKKNETMYRLGITLFSTVIIICAMLLVVHLTGIAKNFRSQAAVKEWIESLDGRAELVYTIIQFAQVVLLPLPSIITIVAGTLVFGPFKASVLSIIGIMIGSVVAFFLGRIFGKKLAGWIVGKKTLEKYMKMIKHKDKIMLTTMFLLPFFPDDILCIVAGLTTMSLTYFVVMVFVSRVIMVFATAYLGSGRIIPYSGWGIFAWIGIIVAVAVLLVFLWKNSEKLQNYFAKRFKKKRKTNSDADKK
jgi:uncharacterized membrane protein YdjX (TVP38/TMEM64 family)